MQNADDFYALVLNETVEDQVFFKSFHLPKPQPRQAGLDRFPTFSDAGHVGKVLECRGGGLLEAQGDF
jgi:hypothetical protein